MNTRLASTVASFCSPAIIALSALAADPSPSLDPLQGNWAATKTNREGRPYSQLIEIKKDQLIVQIFDAENQLRLVAKGTIKAEKAGPFDVLFLSNIRGGRSLEEMESVDDSMAVVYAVRDGKLFLASNFDKERNNQPPNTDMYVRKEAAPAAASASSESETKLLGTWKLQLTMADNTLDYGLRIAKMSGRLEGTLISPRSGEHKCRSVQSKGDELRIEIEREIQGNQATFVYEGKLTAAGLSGKISVKGLEDQFSGSWKASK
jgi:hypothetical protein